MKTVAKARPRDSKSSTLFAVNPGSLMRPGAAERQARVAPVVCKVLDPTGVRHVADIVLDPITGDRKRVPVRKTRKRRP